MNYIEPEKVYIQQNGKIKNFIALTEKKPEKFSTRGTLEIKTMCKSDMHEHKLTRNEGDTNFYKFQNRDTWYYDGICQECKSKKHSFISKNNIPEACKNHILNLELKHTNKN